MSNYLLINSKNPVIIKKRFELEVIAARVAKEHRRLFTGLAAVANIWIDNEIYTHTLQLFCQSVPVFPIQYTTEMAGWNRLIIDAANSNFRHLIHFVGNYLVTKQVQYTGRF